jgi:beta-xylosidase
MLVSMAPMIAPKLHTNPVYAGYFADPFVWRSSDTYYAVGTGSADAAGETLGKAFTLLQSSDFFTWKFAANALIRPDPALGNNFWAPEVAEHDGWFYLYYSVGHGDKNHQLRVAKSADPQGPYKDMGLTLVDLKKCPFAIDPHPFQDEDGQWYLFYARDFLDTNGGFRAGTGLMVAKFADMTRLENDGQMVMRARYDWQRFQSHRMMYDRIWDWHTLEGPCVRKHDGKYYCFYSGGRWETENYGVDYVTSDSVMGPYSDFGSEGGPRVLRTVPGHVFGPGHNSIVVGPDGETEYICYHAWDKEMKSRQMCIDRLIWTHEGPRCEGPTYASTPHPVQ